MIMMMIPVITIIAMAILLMIIMMILLLPQLPLPLPPPLSPPPPLLLLLLLLLMNDGLIWEQFYTKFLSENMAQCIGIFLCFIYMHIWYMIYTNAVCWLVSIESAPCNMHQNKCRYHTTVKRKWKYKYSLPGTCSSREQPYLPRCPYVKESQLSIMCIIFRIMIWTYLTH